MRLPSWAAFWLTALLVGCGATPQPTASGPGWDSEFAQARQETTSDFALQILADNEITDEEFQEAQQRYIQCFADAGYPGSSFDEGGSFSLPDEGYSQEEVNQLRSECSDRLGFAYIESLYLEIRSNPANVDQGALIAACLVRHKVVDASYNVSDYNRDMDLYLSSASADTEPAEAIRYTDSARGPQVFYTCVTDPAAAS